MQIVIEIPEKEFATEIEEKFQDFFKRLEVETKEHMINGTNLVCGTYELETIEMFLNAFKNATPLPKEHGRLIDAKDVDNHIIGSVDLRDCPTIIEADAPKRRKGTPREDYDPHVAPVRKKGKWLNKDTSGYHFYGRCSECGQEFVIDAWYTENMKYCPACGARMENN